MDQEIAFGLIAAVIGTLVVSMFYFAEPTTQAQAQDAIESSYSPDDIRYPLQMAEKKAKAKQRSNKVAPTPAPEPPAYDPDSYYDEGSDSTTGDSDIEQPPAEEPEIE